MSRSIIAFTLLSAASWASTASADAALCGAAKLAEIRMPHDCIDAGGNTVAGCKPGKHVRIDCSASLNASDKVTRALVFQGDSADGVTFDCNGATIAATEGHDIRVASIIEPLRINGEPVEIDGKPVAAKESSGLYKRQAPEDITIKDCKVLGSVRVWGLGVNGESGFQVISSRDVSAPGHVARARHAAPSRITFDNVDIVATGGNPFYLAPGVTRVTLKNSELSGKSSAVAVYLDAESAFNVLENNNIHVSTEDGAHPQVAIDGSQHNRIVGNRFAELDDGGIYLYRNCGQQDAVRYSTPSYNEIINNVFYYKTYRGGSPAIYLSARDGGRAACDDDDSLDIPNSSANSNKDHASHNAIMQNQFYEGPPNRISKGDSAWRNEEARNTVVKEHVNRKSGCFLLTAYQTTFIEDQERAELIENVQGEPSCVVKECNDNELTTVASCSAKTVDFGCQTSNADGSCDGEVECPVIRSGEGGRFAHKGRIISAKAVCDLEGTAVTNADVDDTRAGLLRVERKSDSVGDGRCEVGAASAVSDNPTIRGSDEDDSVVFSCQERDRDGGDCEIRGRIYCH